jgi:hypothetical protein
VWHEISKHGLSGLIFEEGTISTQCHLQQLQNEVISVILGAEEVETTFFQQDGAHPHTDNVILDVLHGVFSSRVLNTSGVGGPLPPIFTGHESL